jgi:hypothetical protein
MKFQISYEAKSTCGNASERRDPDGPDGGGGRPEAATAPEDDRIPATWL